MLKLFRRGVDEPAKSQRTEDQLRWSVVGQTSTTYFLLNWRRWFGKAQRDAGRKWLAMGSGAVVVVRGSAKGVAGWERQYSQPQSRRRRRSGAVQRTTGANKVTKRAGHEISGGSK